MRGSRTRQRLQRIVLPAIALAGKHADGVEVAGDGGAEPSGDGIVGGRQRRAAVAAELRRRVGASERQIIVPACQRRQHKLVIFMKRMLCQAGHHGWSLHAASM